MSILSEIKFSYKEAKNQKSLFTPQHTRFICNIEYNGVDYTFDYQCNTRYVTPNKASVIECLLLDYYAGEMSYNDFCSEFGYDQLEEESVKIYEECEDTFNAFRTMFDDDEIEQIHKEINE